MEILTHDKLTIVVKRTPDHSPRSTSKIHLPEMYVNTPLSWPLLITILHILDEILDVDTYLCPPLSSVSDCFQTSPNATLTSRPSRMLWPSGAMSFALVPGRSVEKMEPKSCKEKSCN